MEGPKIPSKKSQEKLIEKFNKKYAVGDKLTYLNDNKQEIIDTVIAPASLLGGHTAVMWLQNVKGCYKADRVVGL